MNPAIRVQLSVMMFIQFFVGGVWVVTMGSYLNALGFSGVQIGYAYSTTAWAAIVSPFFVGMVADRFFSAQRIMGVLHLLGAVFMFSAAWITESAITLDVAGISLATPALFVVLLLAYALCYMPTLALVNAISFNQMDDVGKQFPLIRVFGTLGWIVAGLTITGLGYILSQRMEEGFVIDASVIPLRMAAVASLIMGIYSFTLPNTPPKGRHAKVTARDVLGLDALALMKSRSFTVFVISSLLLSIPLAFYYNWANVFLNEVGMEGVAARMTLGQMSEAFFLVLIPILLPILGIKRMLMVGMAAWLLRYILFAYGGVGGPEIIMLYSGILLHGICFDFFFVSGQMYVDEKAPREIRASAQGFIALITYGVGMAIGAYVAGYIVDMYAVTEIIDGEEVTLHAWNTIWLIPAGMAMAILVFFTVLFNDKIQPHQPQLEAAREDAPSGA